MSNVYELQWVLATSNEDIAERLVSLQSEIERLTLERDGLKYQLDDLAAGEREMREGYNIPVALPPVPQREVYLVAAFCRNSSGGGYWRIHRDAGRGEYDCYDDAAAAALRLDSRWTERCVIKIVLGKKCARAKLEALR